MSRYWMGLARFSHVRAALATTADGRLEKTPDYAVHFDSSDKGALSYTLGMVTAVLVGQRLLRLKHLVHFDSVLLARGESLGRVRPDLIGRTVAAGVGGVTAIEAKGTGGPYSHQKTRDAKYQLQASPYEISLDGLLAQRLVAHQSYFRDGILNIHVEDPPGEEGEVQPLAISSATLRASYLLDHLHYLVGGELRQTDGYVLKEIDPGLVLGVSEDTYAELPLDAIVAAVGAGYATARSPRPEYAQAVDALENLPEVGGTDDVPTFSERHVGGFIGEVDGDGVFVGVARDLPGEWI